MNLVSGKIFGLTPLIPTFVKIGLSFLPNLLKAARDCQTSTTRQPPGIGPAIWASSPLTGQSASFFLRPFRISLTLCSYLDRDAEPGNSKITPMAMAISIFPLKETVIVVIRVLHAGESELCAISMPLAR